MNSNVNVSATHQLLSKKMLFMLARTVSGAIGQVVIIEFERMEKTQAWYNSSAYEKLKPIRFRTAKSRVLIVEGIPQ